MLFLQKFLRNTHIKIEGACTNCSFDNINKMLKQSDIQSLL